MRYRHGLLTAALLVMSAGVSASDDTQALHVLNRMAFGPRPDDVQRVDAMGVDAYITQQLHPDSMPLPEDLQQQLDALDTLKLSPTELFEKYGPPERKQGGDLTPEQLKALKQRDRMVAEQAMDSHLLLAIESPRQLQEVMVNFWFNHFNVFDQKGLVSIWVGSIRTRRHQAACSRPFPRPPVRDRQEPRDALLSRQLAQ